MERRPNIVFIISDDQGYWSLGCSGNREILTPNIDRLAACGMRFENFFCASPVCSPARASLLTGTIPSRHGVHDWLKDDDERQASLEYLAGQYSYTRALVENGYCCALSGKWHMGASGKVQQGFTHWFSHKSGGGPYYGAPMYRDGKLYREERYVTDAITDDAVSFLESRTEDRQPFYLHVAYTAPHAPWLNNHPKEYTELYKDCPFESVPHLPRHPDSIYLTDEVAKDERGNLIGYYAAITAMDAGIGRILGKLDEMGLTENTLVVFTSDNGFSCGHHGFWGKGNATFPLNMYEESIKVPFIACHPGHIPEGSVCDALVSAYDFMPTLLEYLDIKPSDTLTRPGVSFAAALRGEAFAQHEEVVVLDEYGPNRMIRGRRFKYVVRYPYGPNELYDLQMDSQETKNLLNAGGFESLETKMRQRLEEWFAKYVNPEIDGAREAVYGSGQTGLAGMWGKGVPAYSCDDYIKENHNFAPYRIR
ncbi:sulfatase-like hydrolase/transferase [Marvinbryantia formatexigens]|uniref:sulfatase-like hydrolase/transferase n=1 Tax=Marvinbryantia formatexigens TaxID=168384 RepID=UPI0003165B6A|nr:sulfatase-like hydrolase/transferase [Marvinbryantia formatexigens]UWO26316.1 sulfatase-like hydrolase/transferase [Marvinbryantia formatexigens DSM 14469]SDG07971.1 Arylsulfatase A [Marvinbryantia formatexigens]